MSNPFEVDSSYNPFAVESAPQNNNVNTFSTDPTPAPTQTYQDPNPYTQSQPQPAYTSDSKGEFKDPVTGLKISVADLEAREAALQRREDNIRSLEGQLEEARANGTVLNTHPKNYPIILKWYKYYPDEDIPEDSRSLVQKLYWWHYAGALILAINAICTCFVFAPGANAVISSPTMTVILAVAYLILVTPITIDVCFVTFYNALSQKKALKYVGFLIAYAISFIFFAFLAISWDDYGSVGWINSINLLTAQQNKWVGGVGMVFSILATLYVVGHGWLWWLAMLHFKKGDFKRKAAAEAAGIAANYANEHKEDIADFARENPELAANAAKTAYEYA